MKLKICGSCRRLMRTHHQKDITFWPQLLPYTIKDYRGIKYQFLKIILLFVNISQDLSGP